MPTPSLPYRIPVSLGSGPHHQAHLTSPCCPCLEAFRAGGPTRGTPGAQLSSRLNNDCDRVLGLHGLMKMRRRKHPPVRPFCRLHALASLATLH